MTDVNGAVVLTKNRNDEIALGMTLLGLIFSSILYGITLTQTYKYFLRFQRDPFFVKILVVAVFLLDTVSVIFVGHASWYYLVTSAPRRISVWSLNVELALSMAISAISETFLAVRVWKFSDHKHMLTLGLLLLALLHFVSGEVSAVQFLLLKRFAKFNSAKVPSILRLSSAALCDTGIAMSSCYFLRKRRTGFRRTDRMIDHMIIFSINSGLLTSVASIACLITYLVVPRTWVYLALCFLITRLYANTFLCSLNSRQILRTSGERDANSPIPRFRPKRIKSALSRRSDYGANIGEKTPTQIDVFVVTETISDGPPSRPDTGNLPKTPVAHGHPNFMSDSSNGSNTSLGETSSSSLSDAPHHS
ncbi:hypothetical protein BDQ12DRAFT_390902 [Crucibulum laeve]|uniref:DUF6534 domain-containing protein n=1 Tax=Crucibulum laeve TaxID=68775 RepID=A0A5C3MKD7_9AGAR|nr:hypothetical protein BDQ12DRAFT_390902 [Crucibulum laeve]